MSELLLFADNYVRESIYSTLTSKVEGGIEEGRKVECGRKAEGEEGMRTECGRVR